MTDTLATVLDHLVPVWSHKGRYLRGACATRAQAYTIVVWPWNGPDHPTPYLTWDCSCESCMAVELSCEGLDLRGKLTLIFEQRGLDPLSAHIAVDRLLEVIDTMEAGSTRVTHWLDRVSALLRQAREDLARHG